MRADPAGRRAEPCRAGGLRPGQRPAGDEVVLRGAAQPRVWLPRRLNQPSTSQCLGGMRKHELEVGAIATLLASLFVPALDSHSTATASPPVSVTTSLPAVPHTVPAPGSPRTTVPPTPTTAASTTTSLSYSPPPPSSRCSATKFVLSPGASVPAQYLSAVEFFTAKDGVGITGSDISCFIAPGGLGQEPFPVWEVVTDNGGRTWRTTGAQLPGALAPRLSTSEVSFSASAHGWVAAAGALVYTDNGGTSWQVVNGYGDVLDMVATGPGSADALVAEPSTGLARVLLLSAAGTVTEQTKAVSVPETVVLSGAQIVTARQGGRLYVAWGNSDRIMAASASGSGWSWVTPPCPAVEVELSARQGGTPALLASGEGNLTAICGYDVGMLEEAKVVRASADAGRSWRTVASWLLTGRDSSGLPGSSMMAVFTGPDSHIYMANRRRIRLFERRGTPLVAVRPDRQG